MPQRSFYTILSDDLIVSKEWYVALFGYDVEFDSDWFVHLVDPSNRSIELGIMDRGHEIVPEAARGPWGGGMPTLVVDDVDAVHAAAVTTGIEVVEEPKNLFYGQRRMVLADPNGVLVDVSSECPPDPDWLATLS